MKMKSCPQLEERKGGGFHSFKELKAIPEELSFSAIWNHSNWEKTLVMPILPICIQPQSIRTKYRNQFLITSS